MKGCIDNENIIFSLCYVALEVRTWDRDLSAYTICSYTNILLLPVEYIVNSFYLRCI